MTMRRKLDPINDYMRGKWYIENVRWVCDCKHVPSKYWGSTRSANTRECKRCGVYRPRRVRKTRKDVQ